MICVWENDCCLMLSKKDVVGEFVRIVPGTNYVDNDEWELVKDTAKRYIDGKKLSVYVVKGKDKSGAETIRPATLEELDTTDKDYVFERLVSTQVADELKLHTNKEGLLARIERVKMHIEKEIIQQTDSSAR